MTKPLQYRNPSTGELAKPVAFDDAKKIEHALASSHAALPDWKRASFSERGVCLRRAGELLRKDAEKLAQLAAVEMGKPLAQGKAEAEKCALVCDYYADNGARFLADQTIQAAASETFVSYRPLGLVLGIMPWNFPFWQLFRAAAPIMIGGNAFLLKHAPNVPECARAITNIMQNAGFSEGVFGETMATNEDVAAIIADRRLAGVTLTGSTRAGRAVASTTGQHLKRTLLELGGSDPYLILDDADLAHAINCCATSRMLNNGQSCIAAKRFIVVESQYNAFIEGMREKMGAETYGNPLEKQASQGPIARHDLRDELANQVERSVAAGARVVLGAQTPDHPGAYYPATILADITPENPAFNEELFGPVATITKASNETEAIALANHSLYGLGAGVFTNDLDRGRTIARDELEAGCCVVNDFVKSDPRVPFGGIRDSGYGRELGQSGAREFTNVKAVAVTDLS